MKINIYSIILYCIIFFNSYLTSAQVIVKCAGKKYIIPAFKQNTVNASGGDFENFGILSPILQSQYDIELRGFYKTSNPFIGSAVVIKGNKEKLIAEAYFFKIQGGLTKTTLASDFKVINKGNLLVFYNVKSVRPADTLLNSLIKNKLFTLPDVKNLTDSLLKNNIKLLKSGEMDPYHMQFELKVKNQYRSFGCDPSLYYTNPNVKELLPEKLLFDQFDQLYKASGQERNHLFP